MKRIAVRALQSTVVVIIAVLSATSCGVDEQDLAYTNPEWRESVSETVTFPLQNTVSLSVGLTNYQSDLPNPSRTWLKNQTNIELRYVAIPTSPGEVELGAMMRAGNLPDLIRRNRIGYMVYEAPELFVDFMEFRHLTPTFNDLVSTDEVFRNGVASTITMDDRLLTLGEYDLADMPYVVSLAYRKDLFRKYGYNAETWEELYQSLKSYKGENPNSFPFALTSDSMHYNLPAMFGSGLSERDIVYYDTDTATWVAGPLEREFKEYVFFTEQLYRERLMIPDIFSMREEDLYRYIAQPDSLMAIVRTGTGTRYQNLLDNYGGLNAEAEWDGTGSWYAPLPLPRNSMGNTGTVTTEMWSPVADGWMVYTQSEHVAEAVAFVDFLLLEETALVMDYGPEGIIWNYEETERGTEPRMIADIKTGYNPNGNQSFSEFIEASNLSFGIPIRLLHYDPVGILGLGTDPIFRYHSETEVGTYVNQRAIPFQPGLRTNRSPDFDDETVSLRVGLQTDISSWVAQFVVGQRSLDEYDEFLQLMEKRGLKELADTYNANSNFPSEDLIFGEQ